MRLQDLIIKLSEELETVPRLYTAGLQSHFSLDLLDTVVVVNNMQSENQVKVSLFSFSFLFLTLTLTNLGATQRVPCDQGPETGSLRHLKSSFNMESKSLPRTRIYRWLCNWEFDRPTVKQLVVYGGHFVAGHPLAQVIDMWLPEFRVLFWRGGAAPQFLMRRFCTSPRPIDDAESDACLGFVFLFKAKELFETTE